MLQFLDRHFSVIATIFYIKNSKMYAEIINVCSLEANSNILVFILTTLDIKYFRREWQALVL